MIWPPFAVNEAKYCDGVVEHPEATVVAGSVPAWDAVYSATDVLQAAIAAMASDIFERMM